MRQVSPRRGDAFDPLRTSSTISVASMYAGFNSGFADAVWPEANLAIFIPFRVPEPIIITNLAIHNGATVSGNVDVGVYSVDGVRLVSSGSTAHASTSALQLFNITDTLLGTGVYYLAMALDNVTATNFRAAIGLAPTKMAGVANMATAFPLPATATFATPAYSYFPGVVFGIASGVL